VNVGLSVSRVGSSAQTKAMKKVSGQLRLDLAQFRELEAFAKFGSDLDAATKKVLDKGVRNVEILKQKQNSPMKVEDQVAIIYCGTKGLLMDVPVNKIREFEVEYLDHMNRNHQAELAVIRSGKLTDEVISAIENTVKELTAKYKN
jgi:F-type H+-transporting ATPase subunit alpha